jgi:hypothetical protein
MHSMQETDKIMLFLREIDEVTTGVSLPTGMSFTTKRIVPLNPEIKFRKMRVLVWAGSTTRKLTT